MLQDIPTQSARGERPVVLETERLVLRRPTFEDVKPIAALANERRVAEHLRRMPHPFSHDHAADFVRRTGENASTGVFLVEYALQPIGCVGLDWSEPDLPALGYWFGVDHWGRGFATEAARAMIDYAFEEFDTDHLAAAARVVNPASRNVLEKCGFQWCGVELHRFESLGSSSPVDCFRLNRTVWASLKRWGRSRRRVQ